MTYGRKGQESEQENEKVQIDVYGVKASFPVADLEEEPPANAQDVVQQIKQHLLRIAVAPTRLVAEVLEGASRLVRALTGHSVRTESRRRAAHEMADRREARRQDDLVPNRSKHAGASSVTLAVQERRTALLARLEALLAEQRTLGRDGAVIFLDDGTVLLVLGTHEDVRAAVEASATRSVQLILSAPRPSGG